MPITVIKDGVVEAIKDGKSAGVLLPSGVICMWHGLIANIPNGWYLCNGSNGTPDLREKFVRGAPDVTEAGTTGGSDTHTHTNTVGGSRKVTDSTVSANRGVDLNGYIEPQIISTDDGKPAYYEVLYIMKA